MRNTASGNALGRTLNIAIALVAVICLGLAGNQNVDETDQASAIDSGTPDYARR